MREQKEKKKYFVPRHPGVKSLSATKFLSLNVRSGSFTGVWPSDPKDHLNFGVHAGKTFVQGMTEAETHSNVTLSGIYGT